MRDDPTLQKLIAEERNHVAVTQQIYALRTAHGLTERERPTRSAPSSP
jgi:hypothetical protein